MSLTLEEVQKKIADRSGYNLEIIVNENRSSLLSVLSKKGKWARLSLHRIFLNAPEAVIEAVALFIKNKKDPSFIRIKSFIQSTIKEVDYSHRLDLKSLSTKGRCFDLEELFNEINREYFDNRVNLKITWHERPNKKTSRIVYGQYYEILKLIKINKMLDDPQFPRFFLKFVIYHEMLHHVIPSYIDDKGVQCVHSKSFKYMELKFKEYNQAKKWELEFRREYFAELN
jgi:hypothetical protein